MKAFIFKAKRIFVKEWPFFLIWFFLSLFSFMLIAFFFCNQNISAGKIFTNHDEYIISVLGITGIGRQSYILPLLLLVVIIFVFSLLWGYFSYLFNSREIILGRLKGLSKMKSQYSVFIIRFFFSLIFELLALLFYVLIYSILNAALNLSFTLFSFDSHVFIFFIVDSVSFILTDFPFSSLPYSEKNLIKFIRENF